MKKRQKIAALAFTLTMASGLALAQAKVEVQGFTLVNGTTSALVLDKQTPPAKGDQIPNSIPAKSFAQLNIANNASAVYDQIVYDLQGTPGAFCLIKFVYVSQQADIDSTTGVGLTCTSNGSTISVSN